MQQITQFRNCNKINEAERKKIKIHKYFMFYKSKITTKKSPQYRRKVINRETK